MGIEVASGTHIRGRARRDDTATTRPTTLAIDGGEPDREFRRILMSRQITPRSTPVGSPDSRRPLNCAILTLPRPPTSDDLRMSVYVVIDWLVPAGHEPDTYAALGAVREHVLTAHPRIRSVRVTRELTEDGSPSCFRWQEEYTSLEDSQDLALGEECDEVWLGVWHHAVPGSHRQGTWDDDGRSDWLTP